MKNIYVSTEDYNLLRAYASLPRKSGGPGPSLQDELSRALVVDGRALPQRIVRLGSRVEVEDIESKERDTYTLVLPAQADPQRGMLSVLAPVGTALLGYGEGDEIEWQTPGGLRRLRICHVNQPEYAHSA